MTNLNKALRNTFLDSFEELSPTSTSKPDFEFYGRGYLGKWKHSTMTMFLNDLNEQFRGMEEKIAELETAKDEKIESLESQIEDLQQELKEARGE